MRSKRNGLTREAIKEFNESRKGLEVDLLNEVLSSRQKAWYVAGGASIITVVCLCLAGFVVHRYSEPLPPYLLTINKDTGEVSEIKITRDQASYGEDLDVYWLSQYVIHRETYDFYSGQVDYDAVSLMSTPEAAEDYLKRYRGPNKIDKVLGDSETTRVSIRSVIPDPAHGVATIRFTTTRRARSNPVDDQPKHWIAIVGYEYRALAMNAKQRQINPLGLKILSWRINPETN
ncbi:type IV secretion system protein [Salmonella enterica]|nr:type IV secretion system protein [Salmonella enterica subsp. enterica serovar Hvittingfoss]ELT8232574.1 type IV secretion system protein [Salmonella enterica]